MRSFVHIVIKIVRVEKFWEKTKCLVAGDIHVDKVNGICYEPLSGAKIKFGIITIVKYCKNKKSFSFFTRLRISILVGKSS